MAELKGTVAVNETAAPIEAQPPPLRKVKKNGRVEIVRAGTRAIKFGKPLPKRLSTSYMRKICSIPRSSGYHGFTLTFKPTAYTMWS